MKKEFSTAWKSSRQPRKQRKYLANAPLHLKGKLISAHLSKELRVKHKTRNIALKKGDTIKVMRGKFSGKTGKITDIKKKYSKIYVDGIMAKKMDGSKVKVALRASNLLITALNLEDKKRAVKLGAQVASKKVENKNNLKEEKTDEKKKRETSKKNVQKDEGRSTTKLKEKAKEKSNE